MNEISQRHSTDGREPRALVKEFSFPYWTVRVVRAGYYTTHISQGLHVYRFTRLHQGRTVFDERNNSNNSLAEVERSVDLG